MNEQRMEELNQEEELLMITLTDAEGNSVKCSVITEFEHNGRNYIALIPSEDKGSDNYDLLLFRYHIVVKDGEEGIKIENISNDMEFDEVVRIFNEKMSDENKLMQGI